MIIFLFLTLVRPHLEHQFDHPISPLCPQNKENTDIKVNLGKGHQDDWEEHGLFNLEKGRLQGGLMIGDFYHLMGKYRESRHRHFLKVPSKSTCYRKGNFGLWNHQKYSKLSGTSP